MPFGLKNAAQTFQRLMDNVTDQLPGVFAYIDDVLVASPSAAEHERDLRCLFTALKRFGLVINVPQMRVRRAQTRVPQPPHFGKRHQAAPYESRRRTAF